MTKAAAILMHQLQVYQGELRSLSQRIEDFVKNPPIDDEAAHYEEMRRADILNRLSQMLADRKAASKTININTIVEWARLDENIIKAKLLPRNPMRTSTFWAIDVTKFLCDLWGVEYPDAYYTACKREGICPITGTIKVA